MLVPYGDLSGGLALGLARPRSAATKPAQRAFLTASQVSGVAAQASGVEAATFDKVTRGLTPNPDVLAMSQVQPEFKTPIWDYLAGLVDDERVRDGQAMMARYGQALALAQSRFGVDPAT